MPRVLSSGWEREKLEGEAFLEVHAKPKTWGEARSLFVARVASVLSYPQDSKEWPEKRTDLRKDFFNLHRRAVRQEWIDRVHGEVWGLTPLGLARLQGKPPRPEDMVPS